MGAFFSSMLEEMSRGGRAGYTIDRRDEIDVVSGERAFEVRY